MDTVSAHVFLRISFTTTAVLGIIPNFLILLIFLKNVPKELHTYGIFLVNFAVTELICCASTWLSMNRLYFVTLTDFWFVPIGPCNYLATEVCECSVAVLNACLMNITTLIPLSFIYRYFTINHGMPDMRWTILAVVITLIPSIAAVPLLSTSVILDDFHVIPLDDFYHHFQFDKSSIKIKWINLYIQCGMFTFLVNFIFGWLIIRKLRRFESILAKKTMSMHRMLTKALILHTVVHLILILSTFLFFLEASKIIKFPYSDALPNLIYSTVPFLNGMVCVCYVPHFRKVISSWVPRKSTSLRNIVQNSDSDRV